MMSLPLISIITPSFNRADMIADAIESVLAQNDPAFEHIIIDGGSTDGTREVLERYPHLRVVSEPDRGMYDALNKGLRMARGEIIGLLNTDDRLAPGCLAAVRAAFDQHPSEVAVVGGLLYEQDGQLVSTRPAPQPKQFLELAGRFTVNFPNGWFCRRTVYERVGEFDPAYLYIADNELMLRMIRAGIVPRPLAAAVYVFKIHAGSFTLNPIDARTAARGPALIQMYDELMRVAETHLPARDLAPVLKRSLRRSLARNGYRLAVTALYHRQWQVALRAAQRSVRHQPLWPLLVLYYGVRRILQQLFPTIIKPLS
jgi:glycosyltransferase involved in cell wall biosynthesis